MGWEQDGLSLVCDATKHLISEVQRAVPEVQRQLDAGLLKLEPHAMMAHDYEIMP